MPLDRQSVAPDAWIVLTDDERWEEYAILRAEVEHLRQYEDRGDFVVYRDEWDRVHRELHAARAELTGRLKELEKLYAVLNKTRTARDALAAYIESMIEGSEVWRESGTVVT